MKGMQRCVGQAMKILYNKRRQKRDEEHPENRRQSGDKYLTRIVSKRASHTPWSSPLVVYH
jgi:hypothetical protein